MSPLAKKMQMKPGTSWVFVNAPENFLPFAEPLPEGVTSNFQLHDQPDGLMLFVKNGAELVNELKTVCPTLKPETVFWIAYPKKSSGIKTDLQMMGPWDELGKYGLTGVSAISVNDIWTALRFRPVDKSTVSASRNSEIKSNEYGDYIDVENKKVSLPPDAMEALAHVPHAFEYFNSLAYSHKKEYVVWILSAKQEKTRLARLEKMVDMLANKKRNPNEK